MPTLTATSAGGGPRLTGTKTPQKTANPSSAGGGVTLSTGQYKYRLTLTVPAGQVSDSLYGFPLLVEVYLIAGKATGQNFLITDTDNKVPGQVIRGYNASTGVLVAYCNVDLHPDTATTLYLYYG